MKEERKSRVEVQKDIDNYPGLLEAIKGTEFEGLRNVGKRAIHVVIRGKYVFMLYPGYKLPGKVRHDEQEAERRAALSDDRTGSEDAASRVSGEDSSSRLGIGTSAKRK